MTPVAPEQKNAEILLNFVFLKNIFKINKKNTNKIEHKHMVAQWQGRKCGFTVRKQFIFLP